LVIGWETGPPSTFEAQENDMRIIRSSDLPAVVLVKGRGVFTVAIPESLPCHEVLELASLVLSTSEYEEFLRAVEPTVDYGIRVGAGAARLKSSWGIPGRC
jgi:hypothetical protein